jgi:hypothetical protein
VVFRTPAPDNLIQNPSFADGTASWSMGSVVSVANEMLAFTGASSPTTQTIPLDIGKTYNVSVWVDASAMTTAQAVFDTSDNYDDTCQFVINNTGAGLTEYTGSFVATNTSVRVRMFTEGSFAGTVTFDDVVVVEVGGGNAAPVMTSIPVTNAAVGEIYSYVLQAVDAEGDNLTFSSEPLPQGFSLVDGVLSGTPTAGGDLNVALRVEDDAGAFGTQAFTIAVATTATGYEAWQVDEGVNDTEDVDPDGDGHSNFYEYVLGGDPDGGAEAIDPTFTKEMDTLTYSFKTRNDDLSLRYRVQVRTNLVNGTWEDVATFIPNGAEGDYTDVSQPISTTGAQSYIRLIVDRP